MQEVAKEYYGIILPDIDPIDQGRYKVHIPELQQRPDLQIIDGLWCQNGLSTFRGFRNRDNQPIITGNYRPIPHGAPVIVRIEGSNNPTIIRMATTNVNLPNSKKRDGLYVLEHTPDGSSVEIDTELGFMTLRYKNGLSNVTLTDDSIHLELNTAGNDSKEMVSGVEIAPDHIRFTIKGASFEINQSGFGIKFDKEDSSYFKLTENTFELHAKENINLNAKKTVTILGNKTVVSGTSDLSLRGSDTRITGSQKVSMNGNQVVIDGFNTVQLKSKIHIGLKSDVKMTQEALMFDETVLGIKNTYASVSSETTNVKSISSSSYSLASSTILQDGQVISNIGVGTGVVAALNPANETAMKSTQLGLSAAGTILLLNNPFTAAAALTISQTIAGSAEYADAPTGQGTLFGVKDKKVKTSPVSVLNSSLAQRDADLKMVSIVPEMAQGNAKTLNYRYNV